ncbi:peptidylprolyl isomerase [Treponema sp.]|uniref:peptidylprolyl isomerase n=1 Tax=Treponema sp. TaxID=166 RepID=UPI003F0B3B93
MNQELKIVGQKPKKENSKIGAVIILVISALVFLPFGASAVFQSVFNKQKANSFGSFKGKKIVYEPGSAFFTETANLAQQQGNNINEQLIMQRAFYQTVSNMIFSDAVKNSGYSVPKEAVNRILVGQFTDPVTQKFSQKAYNQQTAAQLDTLRKEISSSLVYSRYFEDLFGTNIQDSFNGKPLYGLKRSNAEKKFLAGMGAEKHSFDAVSFSIKDFPKEEAVKFGRENAEKFVRYDLSVITLDDEQQAKSVLKQIKGEEITFDDAAAEKSQKYYSESDGKYAGKYRYQLEYMLDSADSIADIEKLQKDEISEIIKTKRGYSIFRCDGAFGDADFDDEAVQDAVFGYVNASERSYIENYFLAKAENFVAEAAIFGFDSVCKKFGVEKTEIQSFPVNYGNSSIYAPATSTKPLASISSNEEAYKTAFALKQDEISSPFVLGMDIVVLKCTGISVEENFENASEKEILNADYMTANYAILDDPNFEDNFLSTYLSLTENSRK